MASFKRTLTATVRETDRRCVSERELALLFAVKVLTKSVPAKRVEVIFKTYEADWQEELRHTRA